jgi:predicted GIY-YIG superfamily endonuclease
VIPVKYLKNPALYIDQGTLFERLFELKRPGGCHLKARLDMESPLGISPTMSGVRFGRGDDDFSVMDSLFEAKTLHPDKICLIVVGEFVESYGIDAAFLAEYCGLNPMGKSGLAKAGTPVANIQNIITSLTNEGLSVVILEQASNVGKKRKTRFIAGVCTPESPVYTFGLASTGKTVDFPYQAPYFSLRESTLGLDLVAVYPDERKCLVYESLGIDQCTSLLLASGHGMSTLDCYGEISTSTKLSLSDTLSDGLHVKTKNYHQYTYSSSIFDFAIVVISKVQANLGISESVKFHVSRVQLGGFFITKETMEQVGLGKTDGIPSLLEHVLPFEALAQDRDLAYEILTKPTGKKAGPYFRRLNDEIYSRKKIRQYVSGRPSKFIKLISEKEASPAVLLELWAIVKSIKAAVNGSTALTTSAVDDLMKITEEVSGLRLSTDEFFQSVEAIDHILKSALDGIRSPESGEDMFSKFIEAIDDGATVLVSPNEDHSYEKKLGEWDQAKFRLTDEIQKTPNFAKYRFDLTNFTIASKQKENGLISALNPEGEVVPGYTTKELMEAILDLTKIQKDLREIGLCALRRVSQKLSSFLVQTSFIIYSSSVLRLSELVCLSAARNKWSFDVIKDQTLEINGGFPYWMSKKHNVVSNDFSSRNGLRFLVGANMGGKSTYLRMIASITLLGIAGFPIPALSASIPDLDNIFVRMSVGDDPKRSLSSFGVEAKSLSTILGLANDKSLLLIDELGKGTNSREGAAIAGAVWEHLRGQNALGVFATHWHELFDMTVDLPRHVIDHVEIENGVATHKIRTGKVLNFSAIKTTKSFGLPSSVITRALELSGLPSNVVIGGLDEREASISEAVKEAIRSVLGNIKPIELKKEELPSASLVGISCVYVLRVGGCFYVGETDDIIRRIGEHRQEDVKKEAEFLVYSLGVLDKTRAQKFEAQIISRLAHRAVPLISDHDGA